MDESGNPVPGDVIAEKYLIEDTIGQGGMGSVYLARHLVTERVVAIKWVRMGEDTKQARLMREARSMARVSHPNVVEVLDAGEFDGAVYMAMDYVDGKDLYEYAQRRALPYQHAVDLMIPALRGIRAAHKVGIIHRDLKPANIIVCFDTKGQPMNTKVLDFGVAKILTAGDGPKLTKTGTMVGTPRYMAPEQLLGEPEVDPRTDVYSAGLVLYELVVGRPPFAASDLKELAQDVVSGALPPPEIFAQDLPSDISKVIMKAAKADMGERYQTVDEFLEALAPHARTNSQEEPRIAPLLSQPGSIPQRAPINSAAPTLHADAPPHHSMETQPEVFQTESIVAASPSTVKPGHRAEKPTLKEGQGPSTVTGVASTPRATSGTQVHGRTALLVAIGAAVISVAGVSLWLSSKTPPAQASPASEPASEPTEEPNEPEAPKAAKPEQSSPQEVEPAPDAPQAPAPPEKEQPPQPARAPQAKPARPAPAKAPTPRPKPPAAKESSGGMLRVEDF